MPNKAYRDLSFGKANNDSSNKNALGFLSWTNNDEDVNNYNNNSISVESKMTMTTSPTDRIESMQQEPQLPPEGESPHVVFDDLHYRRVCAEVYSAVLCMIIRFPFEVPLQDPNVTYPKPVDERFYDLPARSHFIDGRYLEKWRDTFKHSNYTTVSTMGKVKICLEQEATWNSKTVLVLFTRHVAGQAEEDLYGSISVPQQQRTALFFANHLVLIVGASPAPIIARCLAEVFGYCGRIAATSTFRCTAPSSPLLTNATSSNQSEPRKLPRDQLTLQVVRYEPLVISNYTFPNTNKWMTHYHVTNLTMPFIEFLKLNNFLPLRVGAGNSSNMTTTLRPLSIVVDIPISHMQTNEMIHEAFDQVKYNQERYIQLILNITTPAARRELAERGYEVGKILGFDGLPQHFPSVTGGPPLLPLEFTSRFEFLNRSGYPGWFPELGSTCRGPLPPNSKLKQINGLGRHAASKQGFDMRLYAKTWEFANQFWWNEYMWSNRGHRKLDCTHPSIARSGFTCVHKVLFQAMIDSHFEAEAKENGGRSPTQMQ